MRLSRDERAADGSLINGFDYHLQVWVVDGIVQMCGHPRPNCCNAKRFAGQSIRWLPLHPKEG